VRYLLAGITALLLTAPPLADAAAATLYDMNPFFNEPHPFAGARPPAPDPAPPPAVRPPPTALAAPPPPTSGPGPDAGADPAGISGFNPAGNWYDMRRFLSEPYPAAGLPRTGQGAAPVAPAAQAPVRSRVGAAPSGPGAPPAPVKDGSGTPDKDAPDIDGDDGAAEVNDPLESMNRAVFEFNELFLRYFLRPLSTVYRDGLPDFVRNGISNTLDNLKFPVVLANDIMQLEAERAWHTTARFVVNSSIGLGGLIDMGNRVGLPAHSEDLGQTLAVWGVGEGFYLVVPLLGPSNPRDLIGKLADGYFDPINLWANNTGREYISYARTGMTAVDLYSKLMDELDGIKKNSVDFYATVRSLYRQKRKSEIANGKNVDLPPIPDLDMDMKDLENISAAPEGARRFEAPQGALKLTGG